MEVLRIKRELSDHTAKTPSEEVNNRMANVHEGHREKLRNRFIQDKGFENFEDHQILELLLFYANSRKDTNPLAHELLDQFGSLKGVLEARPEQLMTVSGIGDQAATLISMVVPLSATFLMTASTSPTIVGSNALVGSSKSKISGSIINARTMAIRCC